MSATITWGQIIELDSEVYVEGWKAVEDCITDSWRWGYCESRILERESDGRFFRAHLEIQSGDEGPGYDYDDEIELEEVVAVVKPVRVWELAK